jgi:FMN phosphatase YigB (HAD superfamily)
MIRSTEEKTMKKAPAITCVFPDIGGVLLTNWWDHHARKRAATAVKLEWAEIEDRHHLTFEAYEVDKLTLEEYLSLTIFYEDRPFTWAQFRRVMVSRSKPYPEMIELVRDLKATCGLKIVVISNQGHEPHAYRIHTFKLAGSWMRLFSSASSTSASPTRTFFGVRWTLSRHQFGRSSISKTPRCSSRCGRVGDSKHSSPGLQ